MIRCVFSQRDLQYNYSKSEIMIKCVISQRDLQYMVSIWSYLHCFLWREGELYPCRNTDGDLWLVVNVADSRNIASSGAFHLQTQWLDINFYWHSMKFYSLPKIVGLFIQYFYLFGKKLFSRTTSRRALIKNSLE